MTSWCRSLLVSALAAVAAAPQLRAQLGYQMRITVDPGDSVYAVPDTGTFNVVLVSYDTYGYGLDSFALRVTFDAAKLDYVSAGKLCPDLAAPLTATPGAGYVDLSTSSCNAYYYFQSLARLTFRLKAGAPDGGMIRVLATALIDNGTYNRIADFGGDFAEVCHASGVWGDVDGNARVNSRDALIALSSAVGIPTTGFNVARGDVDADGSVTSRDALLMLAASINLSTSGFRVGNGIPDRCVPQVLLPRPLYFNRAGSSHGQPALGTGLSIRAALDSAVTIVGDSADAYQNWQWRPRVSPDGSSVLFVCLNSSYYPNICRANADGSGVVRLTTGFAYEESPDWSPDGSQIVFVRGFSQIYTMNADGTGQTIVPSSPSGVRSVSWRPVGGSRRIAYTIGSYGGAAGVHTRSVDSPPDDTVVVANTTCCLRYDARLVDWSPAGDSLVFDIYLSNQRAIMVAQNVGGATPQARLSLAYGTQHPMWTDQGMLFTTPDGTWRMFLLRPDGTLGRIGRDDRDNYAPGMRRQ